jgi:hypothetical protein
MQISILLLKISILVMQNDIKVMQTADRNYKIGISVMQISI